MHVIMQTIINHCCYTVLQFCRMKKIMHEFSSYPKIFSHISQKYKQLQSSLKWKNVCSAKGLCYKQNQQVFLKIAAKLILTLEQWFWWNLDLFYSETNVDTISLQRPHFQSIPRNPFFSSHESKISSWASITCLWNWRRSEDRNPQWGHWNLWKENYIREERWVETDYQ